MEISKEGKCGKCDRSSGINQRKMKMGVEKQDWQQTQQRQRAVMILMCGQNL